MGHEGSNKFNLAVDNVSFKAYGNLSNAQTLYTPSAIMKTEQDDDAMYIQLLVAAHSLNATGDLHYISHG